MICKGIHLRKEQCGIPSQDRYHIFGKDPFRRDLQRKRIYAVIDIVHCGNSQLLCQSCGIQSVLDDRSVQYHCTAICLCKTQYVTEALHSRIIRILVYRHDGYHESYIVVRQIFHNI